MDLPQEHCSDQESDAPEQAEQHITDFLHTNDVPSHSATNNVPQNIIHDDSVFELVDEGRVSESIEPFQEEPYIYLSDDKDIYSGKNEESHSEDLTELYAVLGYQACEPDYENEDFTVALVRCDVCQETLAQCSLESKCCQQCQELFRVHNESHSAKEEQTDTVSSSLSSNSSDLSDNFDSRSLPLWPKCDSSVGIPGEFFMQPNEQHSSISPSSSSSHSVPLLTVENDSDEEGSDDDGSADHACIDEETSLSTLTERDSRESVNDACFLNTETTNSGSVSPMMLAPDLILSVLGSINGSSVGDSPRIVPREEPHFDAEASAVQEIISSLENMASDGLKNRQTILEDTSLGNLPLKEEITTLHQGNDCGINICDVDAEVKSASETMAAASAEARGEGDTPALEDGSFFPRILRNSMRRMRQFRLSRRSFRRSTRRSENSDTATLVSESESTFSVESPSSSVEPTVGLASVTNPATNSIIVTSLISRLSASPEVEQQVQDQERQIQQVQREVPRTPPRSPEVESRSPEISSPAENNSASPASSVRRRASDHYQTTASQSLQLSWPHHMSYIFACLGCTIGLLNISRFALLSVNFGGTFVIQFVILSILFGVPLFALNAVLGRNMGCGVINMWKITPLFQGVGIAILIWHAIAGLYSVISIAWLLVYFRDSFTTAAHSFRWSQCSELSGDACKTVHNYDLRLIHAVPDYFRYVVLQRESTSDSIPPLGALKFQVAFNLAIVWHLLFVCLSKGLRSFGIVILFIAPLPIFGLVLLSCKMAGSTFGAEPLFNDTKWNDFIFSGQSWHAAAMEVFLTWGALGAAVMQLSAPQVDKRRPLKTDIAVIALITMSVLILSAFLANTFVVAIHKEGMEYVVSSFERYHSAEFLAVRNGPRRNSSRLIYQRPLLVGVSAQMLPNSGYQVLRLATELGPTALSLLGASSFWAVVFFSTLILFGMVQQLSLWYSVIMGIISIKAEVLMAWKTTITFVSCSAGFVLGLPLTTERGQWFVLWADSVLGGGWWLAPLVALQLMAVFIVRGDPFGGESLASELVKSSFPRALLAFLWCVLLPIALLVHTFFSYQIASASTILANGLWATERWTAVAVQMLCLGIAPLVGIIQVIRYTTARQPADLFERLLLLYRPPLGGTESPAETEEQLGEQPQPSEPPPLQDPPPQYTPPPSYSTATGARVAKLLRRSLRWSVRRTQAPRDVVLLEAPLPRSVPPSSLTQGATSSAV